MMKKSIIAVALSSIVLLALSVFMTMASIYLFPNIAEEYFSPVFRFSGEMDWMFYLHPLVVSICLKWFWERYKSASTKKTLVGKAFEISLVYAIVALLPILWLTFSAIAVSFSMMSTWFLYGFIQAFSAGIIFVKINP